MRWKKWNVNQDIIQKYDNKLLEKRAEGIIHGGLKGRGCIIEVKRHNLKFLMVVVSVEGYLASIVIGHSNLVKALAHVKFRKP